MSKKLPVNKERRKFTKKLQIRLLAEINATELSIATKCLSTLSGLFSPYIIDKSSCRILITHAKTTPILHDDWSPGLGENRPERALKHFPAMLLSSLTNI